MAIVVKLMRHARSALSISIMTAVLIAVGAITAISPAGAIAPPSGVRAAHVASKGVGLTWKETGENAYRVRFSTSSSMSGSDTWDVYGNYFELTHVDPNPGVTSPRLTPGRSYYFQVKAITDEPKSADRENLSSYSSPTKVTLPADGFPELEPVDLKATSAGATSTYVSWRTRGPGHTYLVRYTTDPSQSVLSWKKTTFDTSGGIITGLDPSTKYYVRARVIDDTGKARSSYSVASTLTTPATTASPRLRLVSYNIRKADGTPTWGSRRKAVAANILASAPDIVALQEATPITYNGVKQYDDIVGLLGSKYSLVTRTGSSGTKLVYNSSRVAVVQTGVKALTTVGTATRYAVWAILRDKQTDGEFFVINTHLEPGSNSSSTYNAARIKQAKEVLGLIDTYAGDLPVVIAGDMNSSRSATPTNGQYEVFTGAGYVDPLDNADDTYKSGLHAAAEHLFDVEYNSFNGLVAKARRTAFPVGTNADYIYTAPGIRVATWRTVVDVGYDGTFQGTIPSDHNLIAVDLHLTKSAIICG